MRRLFFLCGLPNDRLLSDSQGRKRQNRARHCHSYRTYTDTYTRSYVYISTYASTSRCKDTRRHADIHADKHPNLRVEICRSQLKIQKTDTEDPTPQESARERGKLLTGKEDIEAALIRQAGPYKSSSYEDRSTSGRVAVSRASIHSVTPSSSSLQLPKEISRSLVLATSVLSRNSKIV